MLHRRTGTLAIALAFSALAFATPANALPRQDSALPIRGIVRAVNQAAIATDVSARVAAIGFREAQSFKKGDVLVRFDCERLEADFAAASAVHREMKLTLDNNVALDRRGAIGRIEVEVARARVDKAAGEAASLAARLKQCTIVAPFDGRITELSVNEHEFPPQGKPVVSIVDGRSFEIDIIVPSALLRHLGSGAALKFAVDETGKTYDAHVLRVGAAVDAVSQTVKVVAAIDAGDDAILPGMSGTAIFPHSETSQ